MNGPSCWETVVECDNIKVFFYVESNESLCRAGQCERVSFCTCKMRSPSRMRPSRAAMLFGLIYKGRENKIMPLKHFQFVFQENHGVLESVLTH